MSKVQYFILSYITHLSRPTTGRGKKNKAACREYDFSGSYDDCFVIMIKLDDPSMIFLVSLFFTWGKGSGHEKLAMDT